MPERQEELADILRAASAKIDGSTEEDKRGDEIHYWLSHALYYGIDDAIIKWTSSIN
jgi:hypothetical protein